MIFAFFMPAVQRQCPYFLNLHIYFVLMCTLLLLLSSHFKWLVREGMVHPLCCLVVPVCSDCNTSVIMLIGVLLFRGQYWPFWMPWTPSWNLVNNCQSIWRSVSGISAELNDTDIYLLTCHWSLCLWFAWCHYLCSIFSMLYVDFDDLWLKGYWWLYEY